MTLQGQATQPGHTNPFIELGQLLESCGIEESKQKACPPSTRMTFIRVLFDSEKLTLSVTPERLQEILRLLEV